MTRVRVGIAVVTAAVAAIGALALRAESVQSATRAFTAVADARVSTETPNTNFGTATQLRAGDDERSYLRFDLSAWTGSAVRAQLRVYAHNSNYNGFAARGITAGRSWQERTITHANAPPVGASAVQTGRIAAGWITLDVTDLVNAELAIDGMVNLALTGHPDSAVLIGSRESSYKPQLIVTSDATPPAITLERPADGSSTKSRRPAFAGVAGTAPGDLAQVTVRVWRGTAASGTPLLTLTTTAGSGGAYSVAPGVDLADGTYTAQASQRDADGNVGTSAPTTFRIDNVAPAVRLDQPASNAVLTDSTPTFAGVGGSAAGDAPTVRITIYRGGTPTGTPVATFDLPRAANGAFSGDLPDALALADGRYTARASQLDAAGNLGQSAPKVFTVDAVAPTVTLTAPPNDSVVGATPTFAGVAGISSGDSAIVTITVTRPDGTTVQTLTATRSASGAYSVRPSTALAEGEYRAQAEQRDASGNVGRSDVVRFVVDTSAPVVTLTAPANSALLTDSTPTIAGTASTGPADSTGVRVTITPVSAGASSPPPIVAPLNPDGTFSFDAPTLADGTYDVQAEQTDAAGNVGRSAVHRFTVDAHGPTLHIVEPAAGSSTSDRAATISGTTSDPGPVTLTVTTTEAGCPATQTFTVTADQDGFFTTTQELLVMASPDTCTEATFTVVAAQSDAAGNRGTSAPRSFRLDVQEPGLFLDDPQAGGASNDPSPKLRGTAGNEEGDASTISVALYAGASATGTPLFSTQTTRQQAAFSVDVARTLGEGTYTARADQLDSAGNRATHIVTFRVDVTAPALTLTTPADGAEVADATPTLAGTGGTALGDRGTVWIRIYEGTGTSGRMIQLLTAPRDASTGAYSIDATMLAPGMYTAQAQQRDTAGNDAFSDAVTFRADGTPPSINLTQPTIGAVTSDTTPTFSGRAGTAPGDKPAVTITVTRPDGTVVETLTPTAGADGSYSVTSAGLAAGEYRARARQEDDLGNVGQSATIPFTIGTYRDVVLADSPLAYWRLGETGGSLANDESPNNNDALYSSAVAKGRAGALANDSNTAAGFDGASAEVRPPASPFGNFGTGDFSVEAWVKLASPLVESEASEPTIMGKGSGGPTSLPHWLLTVSNDAGHVGEIRLRLSVSEGTTDDVIAYGPKVRADDGEWHHVAAVVDRDSGVTVYVDGDAAFTAGRTSNSLDNTTNMLVGHTSGSGRFVGDIDEVAVYSGALSQSRVLARVAAGAPAPAPPAASPSAYDTLIHGLSPAGHWRLGETSGRTAFDDSPNANHGRYVNGPTLGVPGAINGDANRAAGFDGTDDAVVVGDPANESLDFGTREFTVEAWVRVPSPVTSSTGDRIIVAKGFGSKPRPGVPDSGNPAPHFAVFVTDDCGQAPPLQPDCNPSSTNHLGEIGVSIGDGTRVQSGYGPRIRVDDGEWHHVVVQFERTVGTRVYVDGAGVNQISDPPSNPGSNIPAAGSVSNSASFVIGQRTGSWRNFLGEIDEVAVYEGLIPPAEILAHKQLAQPPATSTPPTTGATATLIAAGDIAACDSLGDEATADIVQARLAGMTAAERANTIVAAVGDTVYESGLPGEYAACYEPSWGRDQIQAITRPAVGDHEYRILPNAEGFFEYYAANLAPFGATATQYGYYSYDLGEWHVVVLNTASSCGRVPGGCAPGSPMEQWLRADLAASTKSCTVAYFDRPRFTSGDRHGGTTTVQPLWQALYDHGAEIIMSGDNHIYERFTPMTPSGIADPARGIRFFTVGTGGRMLYGIRPELAFGSEVADNTAFGVLELTLRPGGYDWLFHPEAGRSFSDSGSDTCH